MLKKLWDKIVESGIALVLLAAAVVGIIALLKWALTEPVSTLITR